MHKINTIDHSTRTTAQFLALLKVYGIEELVGMRTIQRSGHNLQFGTEKLAASLRQAANAFSHPGNL